MPRVALQPEDLGVPSVTRHSGADPAAMSWGLLLLLIGLLLVLDQRYNAVNTRPATFDDAWYLETSLIFHHRLTTAGFGAFFDTYAASFGIKAPLMSVLPLTFYRFFGTSYRSALMVNSVFIVVSSVYLFLLVRRLFSPGVALASVVFYQTMPLVYGLARVFMVDYGLAALVIVFLYYLAASEQLTRGAANFALGVVFGLGLLLKVLFPALVAGPIVLTLVQRRRQPPAEHRESFWLWRLCAHRPLIAAAIPAVALAATWYTFHLTTVLGFAWQGAYGSLAEFYGAGGLRGWLLSLVNEAMSFYYFGVLVALLGLGLLTRRKWEWPKHSMVFVLSWLVPPFVAYAAGRNREIRLTIPLLPAVAVCLAVLVFQLSSRRIVRAALVALLAAFPVASLVALSLPNARSVDSRPAQQVMLGPFVLFSPDLGWAHRPDSQGDWGQQRIIDALEHLRFGQGGTRFVVVGVEHPYFNANLFSYLNAYRQYLFHFTSLGYAETSANAAIDRLYQLDALFLVMAEGFPASSLPDFLNRVNEDVRRRLDSGQLPFRLRQKIPLTGQITAAIYRREEPWTRFKSGTPPPKPSHPLVADFAPGIRFLGFDWSPKNHYLQELTCYWSVLRPIESDYRIHVEFRRGDHVVLSRDYAVADGQYPFRQWRPGEVVKEAVSAYLPDAGHGGTLEAAVWLAAPGHHGAVPLVAPETSAHSGAILLNLEE